LRGSGHEPPGQFPFPSMGTLTSNNALLCIRAHGRGALHHRVRQALYFKIPLHHIRRNPRSRSDRGFLERLD